MRLGKRSSSSNHEDAVRLLQQVDSKLAKHLHALIDLKSPSQYGAALLSDSQVKRGMRAVAELVDAAERIVAGA